MRQVKSAEEICKMFEYETKFPQAYALGVLSAKIENIVYILDKLKNKSKVDVEEYRRALMNIEGVIEEVMKD